MDNSYLWNSLVLYTIQLTNGFEWNTMFWWFTYIYKTYMRNKSVQRQLSKATYTYYI